VLLQRSVQKIVFVFLLSERQKGGTLFLKRAAALDKPVSIFVRLPPFEIFAVRF
jgi:hypothetical protein